MDVTCQRCKAEYEFDETLLGEKGTTVKCSSCGHVFRVLPPEHERARSQLRLRYAKDATIQPLGSLRELQQLIRSGEVSLDDELGRDGFPFRRLRELPELKNFFVRSPEKTTVKPEPAATAPTFSARANPDLTPSVPVRMETLLGAAPTAHPAAMPQPADEPGAGAEILDAPTVVAPIPEEIRPRPARAEPKRTMLGVGPGLGETPLPRVANPAATLGPAAAMARGRSQPAAALRPSPKAGEPPTVSPAGTLVGAPARAFTSPTEPRPRPRNEPPFAPRIEPPLAPPTPPPAYEPVPALREQRAPIAAASLPAAPMAPASLPAAPMAPASLPAAPMAPGASAAPAGRSRAPEGPSPVRLYLDDDEMPPERATSSSSKLWLLPLLGVLAAGGYFAFNAWQDAQEAGSAVGPELQTADAAVATDTASAEAGLASAEPVADAATAQDPSAASDAPSEGASTARAEAPSAKSESSKAEPSKKAAEPRAASEDKEEKAPEERARRGATAAEPKDYGEWVARGDQLGSRGDQEGAAKAYEAALALRPTGSEANSGLGFALLSRGRAREALPHLDRAASSGYAEANIGLGDAYRKLGQPSSALEAYRTYLDRLPSGVRASYAKTWIGKLEKGESEPSPTAPTPAPAQDTGYRPAGELVEQPPVQPSAPAGEMPQ